MKRTRLTGPEHQRVVRALLERLDGITVGDANEIIFTVLSSLPELRLGGVREVSELWRVPRSTAMERIRRLGDDFAAPVAELAAATVYDLDEVEEDGWMPRKAGRKAS